ncbi:MAG: carboxylating nicotinate-nucleotide diphosphorylase [Bacteroidetes bacterium]|nr:carboxylating nicotinate-nucleotide diphosphorylase [Bacteroidota bacterium]MCL2302879.1 carboxylating nicotinate-nucleotide diphosphorylase [Lentimicrobiaceae bacterium]
MIKSLCTDMTLNELIKAALREDIGSGDHSSLASIPENAKGRMKLLVKENGIIAGIEAAKEVLRQVDPSISMKCFKKDGDEITVGEIVFELEGPARSMLTAERTLLNFMQRMSGIATVSKQYADAVKSTKTKILDTRKTTPNLRALEKYAVKIGGSENHRFGLYDMIMLKDNHIDFAGGIEKAIDDTHEYLKKNGLNLKIEIETRTLDEVKRVVKHGKIDRIMLDNFAPEKIKEALQLIAGKYETEASGGITLENIKEYAKTGVDYISIGALTHHIKSLDLSLKFIAL